DGFALVSLGPAGALRVSNSGRGPVVVSVDVEGYATGSASAAGAAGPGVMVPLASPQAAKPAGPDGALRPGQETWLRVAGGGVPEAGVSGLLVHVTARASRGGLLRAARAGGGSAPVADYQPGGTVSDFALVADEGGRIGLLNDSAGPATASVQVLGYLASHPVAGGGRLVTTAPAAVTAAPVRVPAGRTVSVPVAGRGGVPPAGATGVGLSMTVTRPAGAPGFESGDLAVGVSAGPGAGPGAGTADADCPASARTCTGFTLVRLPSPASGGGVRVHNYSRGPVLVSLASSGYLSGRTVPDAPAAVTASARGGSAIVAWRAPVADGGTGISGYAVTVSPGGRRLSASGRASRLVVPGVRRDVAYTFTVV